MRTEPFRYSRAASVDDAIRLIADGGRPLAGGQSLVQAMKLRNEAPAHLVDINALSELNGISRVGDALRIGALTRHHEVIASALIYDVAPWLVQAARLLGDVQVRNRGTVGGNLVFGDARANFPVALVASRARVTLRSAIGEQQLALDDFYAEAPPNALLTHIEIPVEHGTRGAYVEISRQTNELALLNAAIVIAPSGITVAAGGVDAVPKRLPSVEAALAELDAYEDAAVAAATARVAEESLSYPPDIHAPEEYRRAVLPVLLQRTFKQALANDG